MLIVVLAILVGSASAFFLASLHWVTECRFEHPSLLFFLPIAGMGVGYIYHYWGKSSEQGNNLILEQIHSAGGGVPARMAPLVLGATLVTHLFGGSVGREGTAVQMGGSIAGFLARSLKLSREQTKMLLMSGVAAGFGAVFGTPFAGAIFALEVLTKRLVFRTHGVLTLLMASTVGNYIAQAWGVHHLRYELHISSNYFLSPLLLCEVVLIALASALVARIFVKTEHSLYDLFKKLLPYPPFRPFVGGCVIILLVAMAGTRSYIGLGEWSPNPNDLTISTFFQSQQVSPLAWIWKLLFTALTLSSGFKGGEVTPLFFIGAALGNALCWCIGGQTDLFAALGFVALFAGASKTPLASTIMSIELFGHSCIIPMTLVCFLSYFLSGEKGIYQSQQIS